ncbi:hypothetical protein C5C66_03230 [Rathayibacter toxicus]|uniref:Uncharacterized protein n=1 Tax=Rathayibacter toxicus TaxID=145458 RepID=A0A2S5Y914_9MICO|nr:hypothetical protein APU90_03050 [Rathayibacter toxicus]PPG23260.1 hypothetical protein C5D15_03205 [Rathayibacter toxicus]PPG47844.1 hypothetical protein C5D16_03200 [Rathayibacter toxicus]PPH58912.1 hypothetical protein C5D30_03200 [Rathayibacter toxicus]PPH60907.1 hypothetical protein C5C93_03235 [Rathayibacter toxicus]
MSHRASFVRGGHHLECGGRILHQTLLQAFSGLEDSLAAAQPNGRAQTQYRRTDEKIYVKSSLTNIDLSRRN